MPRSKQEGKRKKKRRPYMQRESPFPVPIPETMAEPLPQGAWFYYTGFIEGSTVVIKHTGDIDFLHKMGFFGKGTLSRSEPCFESRQQRVNVRAAKPSIAGTSRIQPIVRATVINKRNYLSRKKYKALAAGNGTEYNFIIHCEEQQKLGLEGLDGFEEDDKEEVEEGVDGSEDEADSDDGGPKVTGAVSPVKQRCWSRGAVADILRLMGSKYSGSDSGAVPYFSQTSAKRLLGECDREVHTGLMTLLSEVAATSKETIATFAQVSLSLPQLKSKYEALRQAECAFLQQRQQHLMVMRGPSHGAGFTEGEVIDLDDEEDEVGVNKDNSVVVLDSDDEEEESVEMEDSGVTDSSKAKGWDDYDEEDVEGWGSLDSGKKDSETTKKNDEILGESGKSTESDTKQSGNTEQKPQPDTETDIKQSVDKEQESVSEKDGVRDGKSDKDQKEQKSNGMSGGSNGEAVDEETWSGADRPGETGSSHTRAGQAAVEVFNGSGAADDSQRDNSAISDRRVEESTVSSLEHGNTKEVDSGATEKARVEGESDETKLNSPSVKVKSQALLNESLSQDTIEKSANDKAEHGKGEEPKKLTIEDGAAEKSTSGQVANLSIEGKSTSVIEAKSMDAGDIENDSDASNNSDDVICIESESAAPSKVHNFLSGRDGKVVVTKSVTFMSNNTASPTYVNAKVGFSSWGPLVHFNYSGDVKHLPTVMVTEQEDENDVSQVYERLYPVVTSLVPQNNSPGATIKQRLKGLPYLTEACFKLLGREPQSNKTSASLGPSKQQLPSESDMRKSSHEYGSRLSEPSSGQSSPPSPSCFTPSTFTTTVTSCISSSRPSTSVTHAGLPVSSSSAVHTITPKITPPLISDYLKVFSEHTRIVDLVAADGDTGSQTESHTPTLKADSNSPVALDKTVSDLIQNLKDLHGKDISEVEVQGDKAKLLSDFHLSMSRRLREPGLSAVQELDLLRLILSKVDNVGSTDCSDLVDSVLIQSLNPFQIWLLRSLLDNLNDKNVVECSEGEMTVGIQNKKRKNDELSESESPELKRSKSNSSEDNGATESVRHEEVKSVRAEESDRTEESESNFFSADLKSSNTESLSGVGGGMEDISNDTESVTKKQNGQVEVSVSKSPSKGNLSVGNQGKKVNGDVSPRKSSSSKVRKAKRAESKARLDSKDDQICIGSSSEEEDMEVEKVGDVDSDSSVQIASPPPALDARALCATDDLEGEMFVVNNTSEEEELEFDDDDVDEDESEKVKAVHRWRPCLKKDPWPVSERLHLTLEEAFFLSYGLGCLRVLDPESKALDLVEMWRTFLSLKEQFLPHYVAYHYFRSKGWVPKSGLKFGCDLILYQEGPPFYHGSYSVLIQCVGEGSLLPCTRREGYHLDHRHMSWISLAGLNRITEHVAKELLICYVIWPKDLSHEATLSPECISRFKVKEVMVSRWVSSQEREGKTEEEMP